MSTLFRKIWDAHVVSDDADGRSLLYVDLHLVHEVTSPQAFEALRTAGRLVRRPDLTVATMDHNVPTTPGPVSDPLARAQLDALRTNCDEFGVRLFATGIGTSEVEHVLATQTLPQSLPRTMRIEFAGELPFGLTAKDMVLAAIGRIGVSGAQGHVVEYAGAAVRALSMEGRMTVCNMSIEAGARAGMIAPDDVTFAYLEGRPGVPADWERALDEWRGLHTDDGATFDQEIVVELGDLKPQVTWGTNPAMVAPVDGVVPDPGDFAADERESVS